MFLNLSYNFPLIKRTSDIKVSLVRFYTHKIFNELYILCK